MLYFLMRFKQIFQPILAISAMVPGARVITANSPACRELSETIATKQEKALVFTQSRKRPTGWRRFLGALFGAPKSLVLHGRHTGGPSAASWSSASRTSS